MHPPQQPGPSARLWWGCPEPPGGPQQQPATVDDAGCPCQAASSPRGQQHVSTGHEGLREGDADTPTHTPPKTPLNPTSHNVHDETHQTEDPQPSRPGKRNQDASPTDTVPTASTARSHEQ